MVHHGLHRSIELYQRIDFSGNRVLVSAIFRGIVEFLERLKFRGSNGLGVALGLLLVETVEDDGDVADQEAAGFGEVDGI